MTQRKNLTPYLYIAPFFIGYLIFSLYPTLYALALSFYNWDGMRPKVFVGLDNYVSVLSNKYFWHSILVSLEFVLTGPITTFIALVIAVLLNNKIIRYSNFFKFAYFLPYITMPVAIGVLFSVLLGWDYGLINRILMSLGLLREAINWRGESQYVFFCITLVVVWKYFGYHMIIYLGGLQSINPQLYEAATIDGASSAQSFLNITLPSIKPYVIFLLITSITGGINLFDEPMMLYGASGGSGGAAQNAGMFIYSTTFISNRWSYGSSVSFVVFCIISILSVIFYKINYWNGMEGDLK